MHITKKIDRAFQWAGEKMGAEAKTTMPEEFKVLETEMALRYDGMDRLHRSMNAYVKWLGRRGESFEDKEKGLPIDYLGRSMISHGEDFEPDSEFGNCLIAMGSANERISGIQEHYLAEATSTWLESLERSLAMMKEYQSARKKLENRRLAYDASIGKMQKVKRDDYRLEEELRTAKAKYEESSEDVVRRMQDIKDAEVDSARDLTAFLDVELDYHERCAEELRRVRQGWAGSAQSPASPRSGNSYGGGNLERRPKRRSRSNTAQSLTDRFSRTNTRTTGTIETDGLEPEPEPARLLPIRSNASSRPSFGATTTLAHREPPEIPVRPSIGRANTVQSSERDRDGGSRMVGRYSGASTPSTASAAARESYFGNQPGAVQNVSALRGQLRPVSRINTGPSQDVFADREDDTASGSGSPEWGERSASPATSFGSLSRSTSNLAGGTGASMGGLRKAPPPPPPPSRAKKPPPPLPAKREVGY